jgi:hypothetical protein
MLIEIRISQFGQYCPEWGASRERKLRWKAVNILSLKVHPTLRWDEGIYRNCSFLVDQGKKASNPKRTHIQITPFQLFRNIQHKITEYLHPTTRKRDLNYFANFAFLIYRPSFHGEGRAFSNNIVFCDCMRGYLQFG